MHNKEKLVNKATKNNLNSSGHSKYKNTNSQENHQIQFQGHRSCGACSYCDGH